MANNSWSQARESLFFVPHVTEGRRRSHALGNAGFHAMQNPSDFKLSIGNDLLDLRSRTVTALARPV